MLQTESSSSAIISQPWCAWYYNSSCLRVSVDQWRRGGDGKADNVRDDTLIAYVDGTDNFEIQDYYEDLPALIDLGICKQYDRGKQLKLDTFFNYRTIPETQPSLWYWCYRYLGITPEPGYCLNQQQEETIFWTLEVKHRSVWEYKPKFCCYLQCGWTWWCLSLVWSTTQHLWWTMAAQCLGVEGGTVPSPVGKYWACGNSLPYWTSPGLHQDL